MSSMSPPEKDHPCFTRLPQDKRGLELIPGNIAHVLLSHAIARLALVQCNCKYVIMPRQLPWTVYFPFTCWKLWLACNERIFKNQS